MTNTINFGIASAVVEALQNYHYNPTPQHDYEIARCKKEMAELGHDISSFTDENIALLTVQNSGFLEEVIIPNRINVEGLRYQAISEVCLNWLKYKEQKHLQEQEALKEKMSSMLGKDTADSLLGFFADQGKTLHQIN
jgi:hypothetical protein